MFNRVLFFEKYVSEEVFYEQTYTYVYSNPFSNWMLK